MPVRVLSDGSYELVDLCGRSTTWSTAATLAEAWLEEWRHDDHGQACSCIDEMTDGAVSGVVDLGRAG